MPYLLSNMMKTERSEKNHHSY